MCGLVAVAIWLCIFLGVHDQTYCYHLRVLPLQVKFNIKATGSPQPL